MLWDSAVARGWNLETWEIAKCVDAFRGAKYNQNIRLISYHRKIDLVPLFFGEKKVANISPAACTFHSTDYYSQNRLIQTI